MITSSNTQQHTRHVRDPDTAAGSTSTELPLRDAISHSRLPVETALTEVLREGTKAMRQGARESKTDTPLTPEQIAAISVVPEHPHEADESRLPLGAALERARAQYQAHVRDRVFNDADVLAYAKEAHAQRLRPKAQQDWTHAGQLWQRAQIDPLPYDRKHGDMVSSQIYIATANLSPMLTAIPAIMTLATSRSDLAHHAITKAAQNLGVQAGMMGVAPLLLAFLRVMLLPAMENARQGAPMRSKEMKTRALPAIVTEMRATEAEMKTLTVDMKAAQDELHALDARGEMPSEAFVERFTALSERMTAASEKVNSLSAEYISKSDTDNLNEVFTTWRTRVGMLQVGTSFLSGIVGAATRDPKLAAGILVAGSGLAMLWNQGVASPYHVLFGKGEAPKAMLGAGVNDDALKQDATIDATAATSNLVIPSARHKQPGQLTMADLDLSDFRKQWQVPVGTAVSQVAEYLDYNIKLKEQQIDALLGLNPGEAKKRAALEALPAASRSGKQRAQMADIDARTRTLDAESDQHARFVGLHDERKELALQKSTLVAGEHWGRLSLDLQKVLNDATGGGGLAGSLRHTIRIGLVRMGQPSDFNPQVVQMVAASVQLWGAAGRSFPLLAQGAFRLAAAPSIERGEPSPIPDAARYTMSVVAAIIGQWGVMAAPHLIREKIAQRGEMRAAAAEHGEQFGKRQNLHYKNLGRAAVNLFHAMHISVTGPLQQRRAGAAAGDLARVRDGSTELCEALRAEMAPHLPAPAQ